MTEDPKDKLDKIKAVVDEQAEDESLWAKPVYISENYIQRALRRLHAAIEGDEVMERFYR